MSSNEFFYRDKAGKKQDAALHAELLSDHGPHQTSIDVARQIGLSEKEIRLLFGSVNVTDKWSEEDHPRHPKGSGDKGGEFASKGGGLAASSDALTKKVEAFKKEKGINYSYYKGNYGPDDVKGAHVIEVDTDQEIQTINAAAKHGIELEEQPQHSGSYFKVYTMNHAVTAPTAPKPDFALAEKHLKMAENIAATKSGMKFEEWKYDDTSPYAFVATKGYEPEMHAMAAKHGMKLSEIGEQSKDIDKTVTMWKAEHAAQAKLDMNELAKISGKKGSNEGGVYATKNGMGDQYYIKHPKTTDHVQNELMAAKLYQLAGARTMEYVPVAGGQHVATVLQPLDKDNIAKFNADERHEAQKDFGIHAWLANWDAAGTGGDNQVVFNGHTHTVDVGGALKYRAMGTPKGADFGDEVKDTQSIIDPKLNKDGYELYGNMTDAQKIEAYQRVTSIPDADIRKTVYAAGGNTEMADRLVARKADLFKQQKALEAKSAPSPAVAKEISEAYAKAGMESPLATTGPPPVIPHPDPTSKMGIIHKHLTKEGGTTKEELLQATGWVNIGIPKMASNLNLNLEKQKVGSKTVYKGTQMTPEQIKAKNAAEKSAAANVAPKTVLGPSTAKPPTVTPAMAKAGITPEMIAPKPQAPKYAPEIAKYFEPTPAPTPGKYEVGKPFITAAGFDINTPTGAFKQSLHEHSVDYTISKGQLYEHYTPNSTNDKQFMAQIAKYHPAAIDNSDGTWSIKKESGETPGATKAALSAESVAAIEKAKAAAQPKTFDLSTPEGAFAAALEAQNVKAEVKYGNYLGNVGHFVQIDPNSSIAQASVVAKTFPNVEKHNNYEYFVPNKAAAAAPAPVPVTPPTPEELKKAQKNTKLTAQYVPGAPSGHPQAEALIAEFNKKYEGKVITDPVELAHKVAEFKTLVANMKPFMSEQQKAQVEAQAKAAAQAAMTKSQKEAAEAAKIANLHNLPEEEQREYWLQKLTGSSNWLVRGKEAFNSPSKGKKFKDAGVTPAEIGTVYAFTGPHSGVNERLRDGFMNETEMNFKHVMQLGLDKMPKYTGPTVWRKINLSAAERAKYIPGQVIEWKAFNSAAKNPDTWSGNTHFVINNPKTGVDVQSISSNPSEAEVIMPANSFYRVISVTPDTNVKGNKSHGTTRIVMEEVIPFGKKK